MMNNIVIPAQLYPLFVKLELNIQDPIDINLFLNGQSNTQGAGHVNFAKDKVFEYNYSELNNVGMIYLYIHYSGRGRMQETKIAYVRELVLFLRYISSIGKLDIRELIYSDMEKYQKKMEMEYPKERTYSKKTTVVKGFLKWCYKTGYLEKNLNQSPLEIIVDSNFNYSEATNEEMIYSYTNQMKDNGRQTTRKDYVNELTLFLRSIVLIGKTDIRSMNDLDIVNYQENLEKDYLNINTLYKKIVIVKGFLKWCYKVMYLVHDLHNNLRMINLNQVVTPVREIEEEVFTQAILFYSENPKIKSLLLLLATTGLTLNNIITSVWGDLYYDSVRKKYFLKTQTKREKIQHVHIKDHLTADIFEYRKRLGLSPELNPNDQSPFYPNRLGIKYNISSITTLLSNRMAEAGMKASDNQKLSSRFLRHYFAKAAHEDGAPIDYIAQMLDHKNTKRTKDNFLNKI